MSITTIENQIEVLVNEVTDISKCYTYPVSELGRSLPALIIIYNGISQGYEAVKQTATTYNFEFTLYENAEGRTLENNWDKLKSYATDILDKFRANPSLNGTVWNSIITSGETIIIKESGGSTREGRPKYVAHTFSLEATQTEI